MIKHRLMLVLTAATLLFTANISFAAQREGASHRSEHASIQVEHSDRIAAKTEDHESKNANAKDKGLHQFCLTCTDASRDNS